MGKISEKPCAYDNQEKISLLLALLLWMGIFSISGLILVTSLLHVESTWGFSLLLGMVLLTIIPVDENSALGRGIARWITKTVPKHFPLKVIIEDVDSINPKEAHVIAFEPHSVWPLGVIAFAEGSNLVPFHKRRVLGSSALDYVPLCRHLWKWLGMAGVSRDTFSRLLKEGVSCVVIPGGVQECLHLNPEKEVLYLQKRFGYIKMALTHGVPLIPAFCFGQRDTFRYWFPKQKWFHSLSRKLKFAPLIYWGMWGGPLPLPSPMTLVIGKPLRVEKNENPSEKDLREVKEQFLEEMKKLYYKFQDVHSGEKVDLVIL